MRVGSLFTGIAGFDLGLEQAGHEIVWQCEIDPDARKVLAHHYPHVSCYQNVETLDDPPAVDVLVGGFPCQDVSVAGRRAGLAGDRSGLFFEFMRVAAQIMPRWLVVENVPGLLSSNDGEDMATVLGAVADLGYGFAYRVLDAQYFGVPQRRRRVFIVGSLGDPAAAFQVLFEPESSYGDPPPRRQARQVVAALTADGVGTCGADDNQGQAGHLIPAIRFQSVPSSLMAPLPSRPVIEIAPCMPAFGGPRGTTNNAQFNDHTVIALHVTQDPISGDVFPAYPIQDGRDIDKRQNGLGVGDGSDPAYTVDTTGATAVAYSTKLHNTESNQAGKFYEEYTPSLQHDSPPPAVAYSVREDQRTGAIYEMPYTSALSSGGGKPGQGYQAVREGMQVRRLTPTECERLQGFPDGWTAGLSDSARYRTLGNAVCVPVAAWIGRRLHESA